ncbi:MAG: arsenate reductase ArsC [Planctomycetes bacterium]|nr:arsenate reductase ArsC [Planctomycetota bacterium]
MSASKPRVLFLCTGNSARSQLGEALLRALAGERFLCCSAGTDPQGVNPLTLEVLDEIGLDARAHTSKPVEAFLDVPVEHVIIVCDAAARTCPTFTGARHVHRWPFPDPAAAEGTHAQRLASFRAVREAIAARLADWLAAGAPGDDP